MNNYKLIENSKLLSSIPEEKKKSYLKNGQFVVKKYQKGKVLHFQNELCTKLEIILHGNVGIDSLDKMGNLFAITDFKKDDIIGGNIIFSSNPRFPMTISLQTDTVLVELDKNILFTLFETNKTFLTKYLTLMSDNTKILTGKIKNNINKTIREKIIIYLKTQKALQNTNNIKLLVSKKKLAEKMGIQRTSLSRELKKMQDDGLIMCDKATIHIIKIS